MVTQTQIQSQSNTQELLSGLITTYRDLNRKVRTLPEERLRLHHGEKASVRDVIQRLRDDELAFSQALKERLTGVPMPEMFHDDRPVLGLEHEDDSTGVLISQFGTGRASTLAMLRGLTPDQWDEPIEGGRTIAIRVQELIENDRRQLDQLDSLLGAP